jgi:hypothetical protein
MTIFSPDTKDALFIVRELAEVGVAGALVGGRVGDSTGVVTGTLTVGRRLGVGVGLRVGDLTGDGFEPVVHEVLTENVADCARPAYGGPALCVRTTFHVPTSKVLV